MAEPTPHPSADRNLLFGILALQMDFIGRDALIAAMHAWVLDKARPLGEILEAHGALAPERRALLEALVQEHLKLHGNNPQQSLAAVSSVGSVRGELQRLADADVQASLAHLGRRPGAKPPACGRGRTPVGPARRPRPRGLPPWGRRPGRASAFASCGPTPAAGWARCSSPTTGSCT